MEQYIDKKNILVGKLIIKMKLSEDKNAILFVTEDGNNIVANTYGECCSSTWIEHINLPSYKFPFRVLEVINIELPEQAYNTIDDYLQFYGCKIITDKGDIVIDYRNSSNGYYGGFLSWETVSNDNRKFKVIKEDI